VGDVDCALVGLIDAVTLSLSAGWPHDEDDACNAAAECVTAVIDALYSRPPDAALRAGVTSALHAVTESWPQSLPLEFRQAVFGALVSILDQFSLDECDQAVSSCSALISCITARAKGAVDGEPSQRLMSSGIATAAAAALARSCVRFVSVHDSDASNALATVLCLLLNRTDDQAPVRRAVLDAAPSLPRVLLSALTSFGETHDDDGAFCAANISLMLGPLGLEAEVAALMRAEPGAANGDATSLRAAVRAVRALANACPKQSLRALYTVKFLVATFSKQASPNQACGAYVRSGLVDFQIEQLISRGCADAEVFAHVLVVLQAIARDESESIARKAVTQPAVNAAFAALRAHATTMDAAAADHLCSYLWSAADRFGRRPTGAGTTPAALASAFVPLLRMHLDDGEVCQVIVSCMRMVSDINGNSQCGSVVVVRSCAPVLLEALRRHAAAPNVAAFICLMLTNVAMIGFDPANGSPPLPSELGDLRSVIASLATAVRSAVEAASQMPADDKGNVTIREQAVTLTNTVGVIAAAVVPFQDEVVRDPALLAALAAALRLQPGERMQVESASMALRAVLRIDESGSRALKRALVALLRSTRVGAAFCAAAEASSSRAKPRSGLVLALVAFFTRHGLHVDSGTTPRAARTCDGCGAVETPEQLAALAAGSTKHRLCGRCLKVSYCSKACQNAAWPTHKATCRAATEE
jgi:hypothetical protein